MAATGKALEPPALEMEVDPRDIMHVLFIEHDVDYRQSITRDLENIGCTVEGAHDPHEAIEKLIKQKYQIIIVDIGFPSPAISGDQFIVLHHSLMHDAQLVALTGQRHNIKFNDEFTELGVIVIDKGEEDEPLQEISRCVYERAKNDLFKRVDEAKTDIIRGKYPRRYPLAEAYMSEIESDLLKQLEESEDKERKTIRYKGNTYSISDLIEQIKQKTDIRDDLIRMMVNLIKWRKEHVQGPHSKAEKSPQET